MTPNRSRSYREAAVAIISMAQHESPKVRGHSDDSRAHDLTSSSFPNTNCAPGTPASRASGPGSGPLGSASARIDSLSPETLSRGILETVVILRSVQHDE